MDDVSIKRRTLIRIISYFIAIIVVLGFLAYNLFTNLKKADRTLEYQYLKSIEDLTEHVQNIDNDLTKMTYSNTPPMLTVIAAKIWREAGFAKESLSSLPIEYLDLQNTNKYLSQVGDYCVSLAKDFASGSEITSAKRNTLKKLMEYSNTMLSEVLVLNDSAQTGSLSFSKVKSNIDEKNLKNQKASSVAESFTDFEEGFTAYPTLIYDGPFSDHIMQKEPEHLKGQQNVSKAQAREKIINVFGFDNKSITDSNDEDSKMPSYGFNVNGGEISVTKKGGFISYMTNNRTIEKTSLSYEQAKTKAEAFLKKLGVSPMVSTYYETSNNIMTINYAAIQNDVTLYTDLIKVSVALDNGEIIEFDARGYLTNNFDRGKLTPKLTAAQAQSVLSPYLTVESSKLCLIPSEGLNERLCYEFKCKSGDNKDVLVYINASTKIEEQILILLINENGQLTL